MTEAEWLTCEDPQVMLKALLPEPSPRKLRLALCAYYRHFWDLLKDADAKYREAIEAGEKYVEGAINGRDLVTIHERVKDVHWGNVLTATSMYEMARANGWAWSRRYLASVAAAPDAKIVGLVSRSNAAPQGWGKVPEEAAYLCGLFCDVFRPGRIDVAAFLAWNDGTLSRMAKAIYDDRAFDRLPILADALEDAGCDNTDILAHCRQPGEHVRGCWVVDLLLGKE
jgi:hypothetical protein